MKMLLSLLLMFINSVLFGKNTREQLLVLPLEVVVGGLRVVVFPVEGTVLLPGEVFGGTVLEVEMEVGEEGEGPAVSAVFVLMVEEEGVVVDVRVSSEVLVGAVVVSKAVEFSGVTGPVVVLLLVCAVAGVRVVVLLGFVVSLLV